MAYFRKFTLILWAMLSLGIGPGFFLSPVSVLAHGSHHQKTVLLEEAGSGKAPVFSDDPRGLQTLNWHRPGFSRVVTAGYPDSFGLFAFNARKPSEFITIADKHCVKANFLAFDIDDSLAFDTARETQLRVRLQVATEQSGNLILGYDGHRSINPYQIIDEGHLYKQNLHKDDGDLSWYEVTLPGARLINRGMSGTDLALTTLETMKYPADIREDDISSLVLCDIQVQGFPVKPKPESNTKLEKYSVVINFDTGTLQSSPVRFGLYDIHGSQVIASRGALAVPYYEDEVKVLSLRDGLNPEQFWPHENRYYQYSMGSVSFVLAPGEYQLIASKGPEYQLILETITVTNEENQSVDFQLKRFTDWQQKGWYSGDVHVHMNRKAGDEHNLLMLAQAEDLHVTNLLTMSNIGEEHYPQPGYGENSRALFQTEKVQKEQTQTQQQQSQPQYPESQQKYSHFHALVPGVEAPRTAFRGHGVSLNIRDLLTPDADYFLYHKYFSAYQKQGGVNGYAHIGSEEFNGSWGLALDVPFGLVDFAEIMQNSKLRTQIWYEHLHIGHHLAPAAGSDFPYFDQPGAVRIYAHTDSKKVSETDAWFAGLKGGQVFVTNGPLVDFRLDGALPGSQLEFKPHFNMALEVALNPQLDHIKSVEVIHCGKTVYSEKQLSSKTKQGQISINTPVALSSSGWVAVKVTGEYASMAHSGAIYINDSAGKSICPEQYQTTLKKMLERLNLLSQSIPNEARELEYWESRNLITQYHLQSKQLQKRIELARQYYRNRLDAHQQQLSQKGKP